MLTLGELLTFLMQVNERSVIVRGKIKFYNEHRNYGFLYDEFNQERFFHLSDCSGFIPKEGLDVEFEPGRDRKGRDKAIRITAIGAVDGISK